MTNPSPNTTPVRVGMRAKLLGRTYEVSGRLVVGVYEEGRRYDWQEFQLVAGDGTHAFLEFDEGRWRLMVPQAVSRPMQPFQLRGLRVGSRLTVESGTGTVTEVGAAVVQHVEGRFRWDVQPGDVSNYVDARLGTAEHTVEWTEGREVEHYRGQHLSRRELYAAFGLVHALRELQRQEQASESRSRFAAVAAVAGVIALVVWAMTGSTGRVIARGTVTLGGGGAGGTSPLVGNVGNVASTSATRAGLAGAVTSLGGPAGQVGPFQLEAGAKVYRITVARVGGTSVNAKVERGTAAAAAVAGMLPDVERAAPAPAGPALGDFAPAPTAPATSLGARPMSDFGITARRDFRVPTSGEYVIRLAGDPGVVEYELRAGVFHRAALLWYAVVALLLGLVLILAGSGLRPSARS